MSFLSKLEKNYVTAMKKPAPKKESAPKKEGSKPDLSKMAEEYYDWPSELLQAITGKRMLFIYNKRTSDTADIAVGGGDFVRGQIQEVVGKNFIVVKPDLPHFLSSKKKIAKDDHVFIGAVGVRKYLANAYVHDVQNGLLYIGCMSGHATDI